MIKFDHIASHLTTSRMAFNNPLSPRTQENAKIAIVAYLQKTQSSRDLLIRFSVAFFVSVIDQKYSNLLLLLFLRVSSVPVALIGISDNPLSRFPVTKAVKYRKIPGWEDQHFIY